VKERFKMSAKIVCRILLIITLSCGCTAWGAHIPWLTRHHKAGTPAARGENKPEKHTAVYYKAEADNLDAQAAAYEKSAEAYRNGPYIKNLMGPNTAARYDFIAKQLREQARSYRERAALHELTVNQGRAVASSKSQ
jgi:hypothetical protein